MNNKELYLKFIEALNNSATAKYMKPEQIENLKKKFENASNDQIIEAIKQIDQFDTKTRESEKDLATMEKKLSDAVKEIQQVIAEAKKKDIAERSKNDMKESSQKADALLEHIDDIIGDGDVESDKKNEDVKGKKKKFLGIF